MSRIPVTVITGFLGSGKTTLLNRVLSPERTDPDVVQRIALLINEAGPVGIDHERVRHISANIIPLESGCICCSVRGDLIEALRELFLAALHKQIAPFSRVLIETTGLADPAAVMHTLKYEGFLRDRYVYAGCLTVVDCVHGARQLAEHPQALRQVVQADAIVVSKGDLATPDVKGALVESIKELNAQARVFEAQSIPSIEALLLAATVSQSLRREASKATQSAPGQFGASFASRQFAHGGVRVLALPIDQPVTHGAFSRAMSHVHELPEIDLLRLKGLLKFQGDAQLGAVHGVHRQLYPVEYLPAMAGRPDELRPVLVFIVAGPQAAGFEARLRQILINEGIQAGAAL